MAARAAARNRHRSREAGNRAECAGRAGGPRGRGWCGHLTPPPPGSPPSSRLGAELSRPATPLEARGEGEGERTIATRGLRMPQGERQDAWVLAVAPAGVGCARRPPYAVSRAVMGEKDRDGAVLQACFLRMSRHSPSHRGGPSSPTSAVGVQSPAACPVRGSGLSALQSPVRAQGGKPKRGCATRGPDLSAFPAPPPNQNQGPS